MMETFLKDVRFAARTLAKRPGFTFVVLLTLALGIGANTTIFSAVNAVLLRALPFREPDSLVVLYETEREKGGQISVSYPNYRDWRDQSQSFEEVAAFSEGTFTLTGVDAAEQVTGEWVSANYFRALGVDASIGRVFLDEENATLSTHPVAVLSHTLWQRRFGSDPEILGKTIRLSDEELTIVGITGKGFKGFTGKAEVWIPMMMFDRLNPTIARFNILNDRGTHWHQALARLRPDVTIEQAQAEVNSLAARLEEAYPRWNKDKGVSLTAAREELVGEIRPALLVLLGAVGFVLLIACSNVANLFLVRAASRRREMAIRSALGAGRARLISQMLTESSVLALAGGALGLALAYWGVRLLVAFSPLELPGFVTVSIDARVLVFTLFVSLITGLLFGLIPAFAASKADLGEAMKAGSHRTSSDVKSGRLRSALVVCEIAIALVLLVGAGLMLKSFQQMQTFDVGFNTNNLMTARFVLPASKYPEASQPALRQRLIESVAAIPSVESVALSSHIFFGGGYLTNKLTVESTTAPVEGVETYQQYVSQNFFETLGLPLIAGRDFTRQDVESESDVAIVSESFAKRNWPGQSAIGKRIKIGRLDSKNAWHEIIAVVGDAKPRLRMTSTNDLPLVYFPLTQSSGWTSIPALLVRTNKEPESITASLRRAIQQIDSDIPLHRIAAMKELIGNQTSETRFLATLMGLFSLLALLLAAVGIYGVISYSVAQRTQEIGIRLALGARSSQILRREMRRGLILVGLGLGVGLVSAFALTRVLSSLLFGVSATDSVIFIAVSTTLIATAMIAIYIPSRRAASVDPMVALRYE